MTTVGVTGHQNIPAEAELLLRDRLSELFGLESSGDVCLLSSLAIGADQIVAAFVLDRGGQLYAVIPCAGYERTFVDHGSSSAYARLLASAARVEQLGFSEPTENAFYAAGRYVADHSDWMIAVWDGQPARGLGGTSDVVEYARARGIRVEVIWPQGIER